MSAAPEPGDDSGMLRGETGQVVAEIDTMAPMTAEAESATQQLWGADYRQWPTLQQQQWLRRIPEDDREEYIDSGTWRLYQVRLNSAAAGLNPDEEERAIRDIERLEPLGQAERDWTARQFNSADPKDWPPLVRRRYVRSLDRSQWARELARVEPPRPAAPQRPTCNGCQPTNDVYCDADLELGIGCSQCRQRKRRCLRDGKQLVDRPAPERNFRLKCSNCQQAGEDCEWLTAPMNLHFACGNCARRGVGCFPQTEAPPGPPPEAPPEPAPVSPPRQRLGLGASHPALYRAAATGQDFAAPPPARRIRRPTGPRTGAGQSASGSSQATPVAPAVGPGASSQQTQSSQLFFPVDVRRRKLPGGRYTEEEAPLSEAERSRIRKRQVLQVDGRKCRTCTLNDIKNHLCTRMQLPDGSNQACDRCDRLGIECIDLWSGTVFQPRLELTGTGRRNLLTFWPCNNCTANNLCCDRSRPCAQCRARGIECTDSKKAQNTFKHGTGFGTTEPRYFLAMGYGPWGIGSQRPAGRPDLPGPIDLPFFVTRGQPSATVARPEFLAHLAQNQGQLNLSDFNLAAPGPPYTGMTSSSAPQALPVAPQSPPRQTGQPAPGNQAVVFTSPGRTVVDPVSPARNTGGNDAAVAGPSQQQQGPAGPSPPEQWHVNDPNHNGLPQQVPPGNPDDPALGFPPFETPSMDTNLIDPALDDGLGDISMLLLPDMQPIDDSQQGPIDNLQQGLVDNSQQELYQDILTPAGQDSGPLLDIGDLSLLLNIDDQARRSPSPGPVGGPLAQPDLFSMAEFSSRALGSVPYNPMWDPAYFEFLKLCMETVRQTDELWVPCPNESFGKQCVDLGHLPPEGNTFYVCDPCHNISSFLTWMGRWPRDDIMAMRAYACAACLRDLTRGMDLFPASGTRIFGANAQDPDTVAVQVNGRAVGGVQGPELLPITGCPCGSKLVRARLCTGHRDTHLANVRAQASRLKEFRINNYGRKICPICMQFNGVDHYNFQGVEGGSTQPRILGYACMVCHSFVLGLGEANRKMVLDVLPPPQLTQAPQQVEEVA